MAKAKVRTYSQFNMRMAPELHQAINDEATRRDVSKNVIIEEAMTLYFEKHPELGVRMGTAEELEKGRLTEASSSS